MIPASHSLRRMCCLLACWLGSSVSAEEPAAHPTFERDIRPIFREFCFDCHGATETLEGNLDLRLVKFLEQGGDSGAALVPGKPDESYLLDRIKSGEMPPGEARVPQAQIDVLERWIAGGANTIRPEPEAIGPGIPITQEEREFWAFQPVRVPEIPEFPAGERIRTPLDALIRAAMPEGLSFSPDADRETLIKRLYFDLIGLPPTTEELARWKHHTSDDWYENLVNTLLDSPHYGERWARHWLDVAGYADSEGSTVQDAERPWAWKYRDYVIRALNEDKPFDRFITEQLAGDELAGPRDGDWTPEQIELLTATGFLRMAADGTGAGDNSPEARNKVIADTLKIVSNSLLGMSVACAQCHDHRYDPISHIDYHAMRAVFEPAFDWKNWRNPRQRQVSLYTIADREKAAEIEAEAQAVAAEKSAKQKEYMAQALDKELEKFEEPLRGELRSAYETDAKERTDEQKELLKKHPSVNITPGVLYQYLPEAAEDLKKFDQKIGEIRSKKPPEEFLRVLSENPGQVPVTNLFHRGDHQQPLQEVVPAALTIAAPEGQRPEFALNQPDLPTTGRRLAYAKWLTGGEHPLVGRVLVNRIWMHHFGTGLVATPADFGRLGTEPTHPEVLDWLAHEFVQNGWSLKQLHRLILTSTVWRQSSLREPGKNEIDPENRFYWRKSIQRIEAEILRDRMLAAAGTLNPELYGPPVAIKEDDTGQVIVDGQQTRRSLYIKNRRSQPVAMLQTFDAPVMEVNCESRPVTTAATQSLMMMNGEFTLQQAERLAERAVKEAEPIAPERLATLPALPETPAPDWSFGYGRFDAEANRTARFTPLPHWTGSEWQGGPERPDPDIGWVILNARGGHPGKPEFCAVRRWTARFAGTVKLAGTLGHGSEHGDGVRGRLVSSRGGLLGEWSIHNGQIETARDEIAVQPGDTLDLIVDCLAHENSDSFTWPVKLAFRRAEGGSKTYDSVAEFHGPVATEGYDQLPARIAKAWQLALTRQPTDEELTLSVRFAAGQLNAFHAENRGMPEGVPPGRQVLINLCQTLLNSNEFLYID
jgi:hypothetical protein